MPDKVTIKMPRELCEKLRGNSPVLLNSSFEEMTEEVEIGKDRGGLVYEKGKKREESCVSTS